MDQRVQSTDFQASNSARPETATRAPSLLIEEISSFVLTYVPPIILCVGLTGNLLILLVLRRKELGFMPSKPYLVALAMIDSTALLNGLLGFWLGRRFGILFDGTDIGCKINKFFILSVLMSASWIIVLLTVERFIGIIMPFAARSIRTKHRIAAICSVLFSATALNIHIIVTYTYVPNSAVYDCDAHYTGDNYITQTYVIFNYYAWTWIDLAVSSAVPFAIILVCNVAMVVDLKRPDKTFLESDAASERQPSRNITRLLMMISITFVVTTCPITVVLAIKPYLRLVSREARSMFQLARVVATIIAYVNNSINFILYCLAGAKFRQALKSIFFKSN